MKKTDKRIEILETGTELIALNGFNATGIDAVLRAAKVPKGSFYHYFRSKEDFGLAVIEQFAVQYDIKLDSFFEDSAFPPLRRMRNYFEQSLANMISNSFSKGCLIGNLGQELADQNERFRERLEKIFEEWRDRFAGCLLQAQQAGELDSAINPDKTAEFILAGWEGAILRSKVMKSPDPLRNFIEMLFETVLHGPKDQN